MSLMMTENGILVMVTRPQKKQDLDTTATEMVNDQFFSNILKGESRPNINILIVQLKYGFSE